MKLFLLVSEVDPSWGSIVALRHTSSSPNRSLVGTPFLVCRVGSGLIHSLYQAWTPGAYSCACPAPASADPVLGLSEIDFVSPSCTHDLPKFFETYTPFSTVLL